MTTKFEHTRSTPMPKLNVDRMSRSEMNGFKAATLNAVEAFYADPANVARFEKWLADGGMEAFEASLKKEEAI